MREIVTITLNPAVDLESNVPRIVPGDKLRCAAPRMDPGGGGINISRALGELGTASTAIVAAGGAMGDVLQGAMARAGVVAQVIAAPGETRQSLSMIETESGAQYRFIFPGPVWSEAEVDRARQQIETALPKAGLVVLSGSQPEGFRDDFTAWLVAAATPLATGVVLDSSGAALRAIGRGEITGLEVLRLDQVEAAELAGRNLPDRAASAGFAADLLARGVARIVVLARGAEGSVLATEDGLWFCQAARVPVRSKTGAGDSFVAGFVRSLAEGEAPHVALQWGVAAASAAVMTEATELCRRHDVMSLIAECPVTPL